MTFVLHMSDHVVTESVACRHLIISVAAGNIPTCSKLECSLEARDGAELNGRAETDVKTPLNRPKKNVYSISASRYSGLVKKNL